MAKHVAIHKENRMKLRYLLRVYCRYNPFRTDY